jgi:hypothetical protein
MFCCFVNDSVTVVDCYAPKISEKEIENKYQITAVAVVIIAIEIKMRLNLKILRFSATSCAHFKVSFRFLSKRIC